MQPEMQGVLGGQVRFNIRLRQVGAQATPPLCSLQLWYTFPSGHSPTSTLSGSASQKSIMNAKSTANKPSVMRNRRRREGVLQPEGELCCGRGGGRLPFSSGTHSILPFLQRLTGG